MSSRCQPYVRPMSNLCKPNVSTMPAQCQPISYSSSMLEKDLHLRNLLHKFVLVLCEHSQQNPFNLFHPFLLSTILPSVQFEMSSHFQPTCPTCARGTMALFQHMGTECVSSFSIHQTKQLPSPSFAELSNIIANPHPTRQSIRKVTCTPHSLICEGWVKPLASA